MYAYFGLKAIIFSYYFTKPSIYTQHIFSFLLFKNMFQTL